MDMGILLVVMLMFTALSKPEGLLADPDLWWHLSDARILWTTHNFIHTDPYSFTAAGHRWIDWEWLAEVFFYAGYRALGLKGIYIAAFIGLYANVILLYWRALYRSGTGAAALMASILGTLLMSVNSGPRTIALGYLCMSGEMLIFEAVDRGRTRALWLLPPLFCLWINLHGTWFIGLVLFATYALCGSLSIDRGAFLQPGWCSRDRKTLGLVFLSSLMALCVNPYGLHLLWNPLDMMLNQHTSVTTISEWQSLDISSKTGVLVVVAAVAMILANAIAARRWRLYEMVFVLIAWYAAIAHARFCYFAAVLTTTMLADDLRRSLQIGQNRNTIPALNLLVAVLGVLTAFFYLPKEAAFERFVKDAYPLQTIKSVDPSWRTFNDEHIGGMMDFQGKPTFVDTRWDSFEHIGVMKDYLDIVSCREPLQGLARYRIDHVLIPKEVPLADVLMHSGGWRSARVEATSGGDVELFERIDFQQRESTLP
jgi:hypothetical protein